MGDYCLFCGKTVEADKWREHMLATHRAVLAENPINENGEWKPITNLKEISSKLVNQDSQ